MREPSILEALDAEATAASHEVSLAIKAIFAAEKSGDPEELQVARARARVAKEAQSLACRRLHARKQGRGF